MFLLVFISSLVAFVACSTDSDGTSFITSFVNYDVEVTNDYELSLHLLPIDKQFDYVNISYYSLLTNKLEKRNNLKVLKGQTNEIFFNYYEVIAPINNQTQNIEIIPDARIFIESNHPLKVIASLYNTKTGKGDIYLVPSIKFAGTDYVISLPEPNYNGYQMFNILSTVDIETEVIIDINYSLGIKSHNIRYLNGSMGSNQIQVIVPKEFAADSFEIKSNHPIIIVAAITGIYSQLKVHPIIMNAGVTGMSQLEHDSTLKLVTSKDISLLNITESPEIISTTSPPNTFISKVPKKELTEKNEKSSADQVFKIVSDELKKKVKVFCIIITAPKYKNSRVKPQIKTWVHRCNDYMYVSSRNDASIKAIRTVGGAEGYQYGYGKVREGIIKAWEKHGDKYDWYLKADDDTFLIMENLRMFLINKNPNEIQFHGHRYTYKRQGKTFDFHHGGASYVISKTTVKLLVTKGFPKYCRKQADGFDDREIGHCLRKMKVYPHETRDLNKKLVFVPGNPLQFATLQKNEKFDLFHWKNLIKFPKGKDSLSEYPISFHYISADMFYALEYLLYNANVVGRRQFIFTDNKNENATEEAKTILDKIEALSNKIYLTVEH
uniref:N-acetylgalactosaminide beta-1,3-galactosyltransferase n=1 Tax=Rhabditophanes sp. KR3021 TaxID=114890 RepID=A0AC35TXV2_9BILA